MPPKSQYVAGMKIGRLTILENGPTIFRYGKNRTTVICLCDCGNRVQVVKASLSRLNTSSCGCLKKESAASQLKKINESGLCKRENHYNWRGGISPIAETIRACHKMNRWVQDVYKRDSYTCSECGVKGNGSNLNAHHIITFSDILLNYNIKNLDDANACDFLWNLDNGITLCVDCHKGVHKVKGPYTKTKIKMMKSLEIE